MSGPLVSGRRCGSQSIEEVMPYLAMYVNQYDILGMHVLAKGSPSIQ